MNPRPDLKSNIEPGMVTVMGIPYDENSSFMQGPALAPAKIREVLHCGATTLCAENGIDLETESRFVDLGDIEFVNGVNPLQTIEEVTTHILKQGAYVLSLGGDHLVTYPILKAHTAERGPLDILHLDAHPDLYDHFEGNRYSHACPFARIMEEGLANRLVQIGIRTMTPHQREQADRFGVEVIDMQHWEANVEFDFERPVYISLDMDVLDPGFAPGVSHHEPGGLSPRDIIHLIHHLKAPVAGADIVEYNPRRDPIDMTAMVAVKLLKEIAGQMIVDNNKRKRNERELENDRSPAKA